MGRMEGWARRATIGYDLDLGGYEFEVPTEGPLVELPVVVWDDPDLDTMGLTDAVPRNHRHGSCPILVFAPNSGHFPAQEFPETFQAPNPGTQYRKVAEGRLNETDHECCCHGFLRPWIGCAGEPREPIPTETVRRWIESGKEVPIRERRIAITKSLEDNFGGLTWEATGNVSDAAYPDCDRCEGDGYVDSPGGEWAFYVLEDEPEGEDDDDDDEPEGEDDDEPEGEEPRNVEVFYMDASDFDAAFTNRDGTWMQDRMDETFRDSPALDANDPDDVGSAADTLDGWYWWTCSPGCLPDSDAIGPFETEDAATKNARDNG